VPAEVPRELPVVGAEQPQIAACRRLPAAHGEEFAVRAESDIVDRSQDAGQNLLRLAGLQIPDGQLAIGTTSEKAAVWAKRNGRDRRQGAGLEDQVELAWIRLRE
jgi:hypothetical protein